MLEEKKTTTHLFVKGFSLQKQKDGAWIITSLSSNHGKFAIGEKENALLEKDIVNRFCSYLVQTLKPEIEDFLAEENQGQTNGE